MYANFDKFKLIYLLSFKPIHLEVECESQMHNVPKGVEIHFRVQIVSEKFENLTQLQVTFY